MEENHFAALLAQRFCKENDLSDVTWALLESDVAFRQLFLTWAFGRTIEPNEDGFMREYAQAGSRPDFYFEDADGASYLIEVKISDRQMHFEQYDAQFPDAEKAFIAAYPYQAVNGWHVKHWQELADRLEAQEGTLSAEAAAYLVYLKEVIGYKELQSMNVRDVQYLYDFGEQLDAAVQKCTRMEFEVRQSNTRMECADTVSFELDGTTVKAKFGAFFYTEHPSFIFVWFDDLADVSAALSEKLLALAAARREGAYFSAPIDDDCEPFSADVAKSGYSGGISFPLKEEHFARLCDASVSADEQQEILARFFDEVMEAVLEAA